MRKEDITENGIRIFFLFNLYFTFSLSTENRFFPHPQNSDELDQTERKSLGQSSLRTFFYDVVQISTFIVKNKFTAGNIQKTAYGTFRN